MSTADSSPEVDLFESAWSETLKEPLTTEEAILVWQKSHEMSEAFPDGGRTRVMAEQLTVECSNGERCGVCGRYKDESCWTDC